MFWRYSGHRVTETSTVSSGRPLELYDSFMIQNQIRKIILFKKRNATAKFNTLLRHTKKKQFLFTNTSKSLVSVLLAYIGRKVSKLWIKYTVLVFFKSNLAKTTDTK